MNEFLDASVLRELGLHDPDKALGHLQRLAGNGVSDDDLTPLFPLLWTALRESPDPDRALNSFARWFAAVGSPYSHLQMLLRHPVSLNLFCLVTGSSQYFADLLVRQPEYFEILANPGVRGDTKSAEEFAGDLAALVNACQRLELKRDALRRWKAREMLRIGIRDLIGLSEMAETAFEFSNLADACIQQALAIAYASLPLKPETENSAPMPLAVIGMGKLGGQELNYSSDIDLIFVCGDDLPESVTNAEWRKLDMDVYLRRLAEAIIKTLADDTVSGHVFRVDMRLRPEGRFGALVRSLASCRAYYESWAEPWEFQALLKARCVAGDALLGQAFMEMVTPFVYRPLRSEEFLREVQTNKRRIEQKCALEGETLTNVKTGYGGIRDVEFTVQRLQLAYGGQRPSLRTGNTLTALERLRQADLLPAQAARELAEDYAFLRNLEHRLQLLHGFQTQTLPPPSDTAERGRIARRMGYPDREAFEADLSRRRDRVHAHLERYFYGSTPDTKPLAAHFEGAEWADLGELLDNLELTTVQETLKQRLTTAGFTDIPAALNALRLPMRGNEFGEMPPDTPVEFKTIASRLLTLAEHSPFPDAALAGVEAIALAVPNRAQLYASFDDSPQALERLVCLAAGSPPLLRLLARHQEWLEGILSPDDEDAPEYLPSPVNLLKGLKGFEAKLEALARYHQREILRIGTEDVCGEVSVSHTVTALTRLAEMTLETLLVLCSEPIIESHNDTDFARQVLSSVAVLGLGKLGGEELGYGSDWDVLFAYTAEEADNAEAFALVNGLVERVIAAGKTLATRNARIEIDLRLRPWGRKGALIHSPQGYADYYHSSAETWERQAAVKARCVAGNPEVGEAVMQILREASFGRGLAAEEDQAVQTMKRRIETERLKPDAKDSDIKLGHGGLTDIEWLAQRLQLLHGKDQPALQTPNTLAAVQALGEAELLEPSESALLTEVYTRLTHLRNAMWLQTGSSHDVLPAETERRKVLGRMLGSADEKVFEAGLHESMVQVRGLFERQFFPLEQAKG